MNQLIELLDERVFILDGAMGTLLQGYQFEEEDFRGDRFKYHPRSVKGNNDLLSITQSCTVKELHRCFLEAGADIIAIITFNITRLAMSDNGMEDLVRELNIQSAKIAKEVAD